MPDVFLNRLLNLKVARDRKGMAPNKPLLVLAILDLVEAGLVGAEGLVHKDAQLNLRFRSYSPICAPRRGNAIDLGLRFRHLASDGVYVHVGEGERTVKLVPGLLAAMRVHAWRQEARRRVVVTYVSLETAHIHAHARKGPDSATNGLALPPTAHDLFDAGLWTIDDDLRIRVAQSDIAVSILPGGSHFIFLAGLLVV
jgi:predicted restriction endonuclease